MCFFTCKTKCTKKRKKLIVIVAAYLYFFIKLGYFFKSHPFFFPQWGTILIKNQSCYLYLFLNYVIKLKLFCFAQESHRCFALKSADCRYQRIGLLIPQKGTVWNNEGNIDERIQPIKSKRASKSMLSSWLVLVKSKMGKISVFL